MTRNELGELDSVLLSQVVAVSDAHVLVLVLRARSSPQMRTAPPLFLSGLYYNVCFTYYTDMNLTHGRKMRVRQRVYGSIVCVRARGGCVGVRACAGGHIIQSQQ